MSNRRVTFIFFGFSYQHLLQVTAESNRTSSKDIDDDFEDIGHHTKFER